MNALMCPTEPRTTMSAPFNEIPHRAEASPWITSSPPRAVAPADWLALPSTITVPDIMFSATPTPQLPWIRTAACWFMPGAVVADVSVDFDLVGRVESHRDAVLAARVEHAPVAGAA